MSLYQLTGCRYRPCRRWAACRLQLATGWPQTPVQYADFEEAQEEAIPRHSRRGLTRESIMTHS
jgi:hypothetical protein